MNTTTTEIPPKQKNRTLFQLGADAEALEQILEDLGGDVTDEQVCSILDEWLTENTDATEEKIEAYIALWSEMQARAEVRKKEAARLTELAKVDENNARRLKDRLKYFMESRGQTRIETRLHKISVVANGGKQALRIFVPPEQLPEEYQKHIIEADTDAIRRDLDSEMLGQSARDWADYEPRGTHLSVR